MEKEKSFKKKDNAFWCECGGQIMIEGIGYDRLPLGLGFAQRKSGYGFGIDYVKRDLCKGFCLKCSYRGVFKGKVHKTIHTKQVQKVNQAMKQRTRR